MIHLVEVERLSACGTWVERFLVEVQALTTEQAHERVEFSLRDSECVVPGSARRKISAPSLRLILSDRSEA